MVECQLPKLKAAGSTPVSRFFLFAIPRFPLRARVFHRWFLFLTLPLLLLTACIPEPLDLALRGKLPDGESNTVITSYCQSCHIHRTFEATDHPPRVQALYDREPYTAATQCRTCHLVGENTWGMKSRKTLFPADVAGNRFAASERGLPKRGLIRKISEFLNPSSKPGDAPEVQPQGANE